MRPQLNRKNLGMVVCACHSSYGGKYTIGKWWDIGPGQPGQKVGPYLQNNPSKKSWRHDSSDRVLPRNHKVLSSNPIKEEEEGRNFKVGKKATYLFCNSENKLFW
jgi:hypothetical protein